MSDANLESALVDVRRAYRIAVAFQRRVNDIFQQFHDAMLFERLSFIWWGPNYFNRPLQQGSPPFRKWAWDMFPGFSMGADWQVSSGVPVRRVYLSLETDTGFQKVGGEPDPSRFTTTPEAADTELWVGLWTGDHVAPDWPAAWQQDVSKRFTQGLWVPAESAAPTPLSWAAAGQTGTYASYRVPASALLGRSEVEDQLIEPARRWLRAPLPGANE